MQQNEEKILKAILEALINAVVIFSASLGLLILAKQSGQLSSEIGYQFIAMQSGALGLIRFATYMYQNTEEVTPGKTLEMVTPSGDRKGLARVPSFFKNHSIAKVI